MGRNEGTEMFLGRDGPRSPHRRSQRRLSLDRCLAQTVCADPKPSRQEVDPSPELPGQNRPQKVGLG